MDNWAEREQNKIIAQLRDELNTANRTIEELRDEILELEETREHLITTVLHNHQQNLSDSFK